MLSWHCDRNSVEPITAGRYLLPVHQMNKEKKIVRGVKYAVEY